ncbi:hypothetical protein VE04_09088 [Pseudogymnoascus sp. 24MN13]|nr:hypothetical protein VE04_09088 [Pseudogymnoascus sp. 24MN13]
MAHNTIAVGGLRIGVETEFLLQAKTLEEDQGIPSLKIFAYMVAESHCENVPNWVARMHEEVGVDEAGLDDEGRFTEWVLVDDKSIEPAPYNPNVSLKQWPLELVSPALQFTNGSSFRSEVEFVWRHLQEMTTINTNETCGTHIHLSPYTNNGIWALRDVKAICRSIIYFEFAFEVLLPAHRRQNLWTKSNVYDNDSFPQKTVDACFGLIDGCSLIAEIVQLMNDGDDKYFGWNFLNLLGEGKTTIEFRRPPGVTNEEECLAWVEFTVMFAQSAVLHGNTLTNNMGVAANVQDLEIFMRRVTVSGGEPARLNAIFLGKSGARFPQKVAMAGYTLEEMEKIERIRAGERNRNLMREKMKRA